MPSRSEDQTARRVRRYIAASRRERLSPQERDALDLLRRRMLARLEAAENVPVDDVRCTIEPAP